MENNKLIVEGSQNYTTEHIISLYQRVFGSEQPLHFFLSKHWIINWLECAKIKPLLVTFEANESLVGFVFIGCQSSIFGNTYYLNQTGNKLDDQVWIEYNDIICATEPKFCRLALLDYVADLPACYQFVANNAQDLSWHSCKWREWSTDSISGFSTHLIDDFKTTVLSKNTKSQITRSQRFIEKEMGEIQLTWLDSDKIDVALDNMARLHISQWGEHTYGSGFSNKQFVEFHRNLLTHQNKACTQVGEFLAGEHCLGYLYFFIYDKRVYFYLSAINYAKQNNKFKPGLLMHKIAIEHFTSLGFEHYDFLAGYARYKSSLSNTNYQLHNLKFYRRKWYFLPVKGLVNVKRKIRSIIRTFKRQ